VPVVYHLSRELVKRGHEVVVYTTDTIDVTTRQKVRYTEIEGIKVFYFRNISNSLAWRRYFLPLGMSFKLQKEIRNFDIIHVHGFRDLPSVFVHYHAKKHGVPYVLQAHGSVITFFQKGMPKKVFDRIWGYRILKDASKVIALTKMEAEQYKSMGVSKDKIEIVPNGIDLSKFENLPKRGEFKRKWGIDDGQKTVLYLARIYKFKGLDILAEAFADLSKEIENVKLIIAGPDDGYLSPLKKLVTDLEIGDKVLFTGPLYGEEKLRAYVDADVYVLPSVYETFPVAVLEACACGTPVIVTDRCGIADIVDNKVGYAVEYNKDQLRNAIIKVLNNEGLRRRFGEEGKRLVRDQFSWDVVVAKVENIYRNVTRSG